MATATESLNVLSRDETLAQDPHIGSLFGQYRIDRRLGQGAMGVVYQGVQLSIDRPVALKLIAGDTDRHPEFAARFRREAQAMAKLRHPNTVRLLDFGVTEQARMFMVMELLRGEDLEARLAERGPFEMAEALRIVRQIAQSLSEAHALGIVHRDLKPGNIFLSEVEGGDCFVKVMDFGVAGFQHDGINTSITVQGEVLGTAAYMSPEQAQGYDVDGRADLYSLGIVLFEMLTGRPPFQANTAVSLMILHVSEPPPRILEICPELPELARTQALLDTLLAKDAADRPQSASEVIALVDALLAEMGAANSGPIGIDTRPSTHPARPRRPLLGIALSALLIGLSLLIAWQSLRGFSALDPQMRSHVQAWQTRGYGLVAAGADWAGNLLAPWRRRVPSSVVIATVPSGASVQLAGAELGKTPYQLQLKDPTVVQLALPGHATQTVTVDPAGDPNLVVQLTRTPARRLRTATP
jgi:serine/threonine protein kinase